jgi:hypothetical protein
MAEESELKHVVIETPSASNARRNIKYARACMRDSMLRGETPIDSHSLYTQTDARGLALGKSAHLTAIYTDLGISGGMILGMNLAKAEGRPIEFRTIHDKL